MVLKSQDNKALKSLISMLLLGNYPEVMDTSTFIFKLRTGGCIEAACFKELKCEINIYITEKH